MSRIFLSHSSHDNLRTLAVAQWLRDQGWEDVFLDRIPRQGIAAGDDWKARIHECMNEAAAGIFMLSRDWLESDWCQTELTLAYSLNKLIFGVLVEELPRDQIPTLLKSNWQVADLWSGRDHDSFKVIFPDETICHTTLSRSGLVSLKEGLRRAQIDPKTFTWPPEGEPDREPWRGLSPMEPEDAGIFFGRDAQIVSALDAIRSLREGNPPRLLVIVGASGAGKSSFLRAGIIPRLARDDRNYLTVTPIRPGGGALDTFASSLCAATSTKNPKALGDIRRMVYAAADGRDGELGHFLSTTIEAQRHPAFDDASSPPPTLILPIDQGEELFQSSGREQASRFLSLLAHLLQQESPRFVALLTIRSDSYEFLQSAPELSGLHQTLLNLPPIVRGEYGRIITGPVEKLNASGRKLEFDPAITRTLLAEFDRGLGLNALPLLAFTLDRLYRDYHTSGKIDFEDYDAMNGIAGSINAAVESALQAVEHNPNTPIDRQSLVTLLRHTMIPWFAGIDPDTGTARRNISFREQLPNEALPLVDTLVEQRLLTKDGDNIEPAHEALLREWKSLNDWLIADRELLTTLETLRRAADDWQTKGRDKDYLAHKASRLDDAERLAERPDLWQQLRQCEHDYLAACRAAMKHQTMRRRVFATAFFAVVGIGLGATGYQAQLASTQYDQAAQSRVDALVLMALSEAESDPVNALKLVIGAWPKDKQSPHPTPSVAFDALNTAIAHTRPHKILKGHDAWVRSVAFSPDGQRIVSGGVDNALRLWDGNTGAALGEPLLGDASDIFTVAFSPDSKRIVSGGYHGKLHMWDATTGEALGEPLQGHKASVRSVAFSPDGERIVSGAGDFTLRLWDAISGKALGEPLRGHESPVYSVAFSPDGDRIVSAGGDSTLRLWDARTGEALGEPLRGHKGSVRSVAFSPEGKLIVSGAEDDTLRIWNSATGEVRGEPLRGHEGNVSSVAFSPDGKRIVSGGEDATLRLWDAGSGAALGKPLRGHQAGILSAAFSPDGNQIVSSAEENTLRLWDLPIGAPLGEPMGERQDRIFSVAFSPDGGRIVSGSADGKLRLWSTKTQLSQSTPFRAHQDRVHSVVFSLDGSRIDSVAKDGSLHQLDSLTGDTLEVDLRGHGGAYWSAALSPNGTRIVGGAGDGTLQLWDVATGEPLGEALSGHQAAVRTVAFSPDGKQVVSGSLDRTIRIWDAGNGKAVGEPLVVPNQTYSAAFSPSGNRIISGHGDGQLYLWDVTAGAILGKPRTAHIGHETGTVLTLAFSPDGSRIISGGGDGTLQLWDAASFTPLGDPFVGHEGWIRSVSFSPDGSQIVSGSDDGTIRLWSNLPSGNIIQVACHYLPRVDGRPDISTDGLAAEIGITNLTLPEDCDAFDPLLTTEVWR